MTKVKDHFLGTKKSFEIFCASFEFLPIGPTRLMQNQFVKGRQSFEREILITQFVSSLTNINQHIFGSPQVVLTIILQAT